MNRKIIFIFILLLCCKSAFALDLDMTVDDEIRKNYNPSKLIQDTGVKGGNDSEETLPELPVILDMEADEIAPAQQVQSNTQTTTPPAKIVTGGNIKIRKGTSFNVVSSAKISDWQRKGTTVKFKTNSAIVKRKYTIPAGTVFTGEIIESHQPQITCNGGLVVIRIRSMLYKGQTIPVNAYITRADDKMIFLNNIKGDRTYLKTRCLNQLARELLLCQASDWAFLITTGTATEYSTERTREHIYNFMKLYGMLEDSRIDIGYLEWLESKNSIFQGIDYRIYA